MRTLAFCLVSCFVAIGVSGIDEHRPNKKGEDRGKRNLEYQISNHYSNIPTYRLERRLVTSPQYQNPTQYYSRSYRKDPTNEDLLTENNRIQENVDRYGGYHHKPQIIERPVYIKEPEPIIEIIIKESNVSLPAPPSPPPPPKKKKEQVQVFYVKYKKNPDPYAKDNIIYDKPVPAIAPEIPDEEPEEEPAPYQYSEAATVPPPPSTTLRTIIKPDSEFYHSPSGVKVTFGKEGFDYDKRSSKPEDFVAPQNSGVVPQGRQLSSFSNAYFKRPTTSNFQSLPPGFRSDVRHEFRPDARHIQPYRTINLPQNNFKQFGKQNSAPQSPNFSFQPPQSAQLGPTFNGFSQPPTPPSPQFAHSISHPPPLRFQAKPNPVQTRQPVPYKPFDNYRPQQQFSQPTPLQHQPIQFRPETRFPVQQPLPLPEFANFNNPRLNQQFNSGEIPQQPQQQQQFASQQPTFQQLPNIRPQPNFRPPQAFPPQSLPTHQHHSQQQQPQHKPSFQQPISSQPLQHNIPQHKPTYQHEHTSPQAHPHQQITSQHHHQQQANVSPPQQIPQQQHNQFSQTQQFSHQPQQNVFRNPETQQSFHNQQSNQQQNQHLSHLQSAQNILPPGGQLIPSVSKFEQHISSIETSPSQNLRPDQYQQKVIQQFGQTPEQNSQEVLTRQQTASHQKRILDEAQRQNNAQNYLQNYSIKPSNQPDQKAIDQRNHLLEEIERQRLQQEQLRQFYQQNPDIKQEVLTNYVTSPQPEYLATRKNVEVSTTPRIQYQSTTKATTPAPPTTTTKDPKFLEAQLPDEVPEDLRQQLLSSGILNNAHISVLDYDKVGDIPLSALPPEQLANFYGAGGASQLAAIAGSDPVPAVVRKDGTKVENHVEFEDEPESAASEYQQVVASPLVAGAAPSSVEMKVVRYDPETDKGQQVQEKYVEDQAHQTNPVVLNDNSYNRYLPLKINGTQFPIPDAPELKGKQISSVVVLAPISYDFSSERKTRETSRDLSQKSSDIDLIQGTALKDLLTDPSSVNFKKFLESENRTSSEKQAVILLVAEPGTSNEKEIFMYDVGTQSVSKLNGELSSAFVEAAEANSVEKQAATDRRDKGDLEDASSENHEARVPIIDPLQEEDMETQASEHLESFVDISGHPIDDLMAQSTSNFVSKRKS
ncbi:unnamed protein product [Phyllotreta striolata]|uniref:Uncharacterized protein n=1 Tax=Phyllotreta striolata TaxID=444603 RepID=A0A9P0DV46_PHYSR|nr:unnamed protein product [Phyllotreta striolata]